jgi:hypothetical protein
MKNNPNFFSQMISSTCTVCKPLYLMKTFPSWAYVDNLVLFHVILPSKLQYFTKKVSKNVDSGKKSFSAENESHDRPPSHLHKTKSSKTKKQQNS